MKPFSNWVILATLFIGTTMIIHTASAGEAPGAALVMDRCTYCHNTERICNSLGRKKPATWRLTVRTMKSKGAKVSKAEIEQIVAYLAGLPKGSAPVCP